MTLLLGLLFFWFPLHFVSFLNIKTVYIFSYFFYEKLLVGTRNFFFFFSTVKVDMFLSSYVCLLHAMFEFMNIVAL